MKTRCRAFARKTEEKPTSKQQANWSWPIITATRNPPNKEKTKLIPAFHTHVCWQWRVATFFCLSFFKRWRELKFSTTKKTAHRLARYFLQLTKTNNFTATSLNDLNRPVCYRAVFLVWEQRGARPQTSSCLLRMMVKGHVSWTSTTSLWSKKMQIFTKKTVLHSPYYQR